MYLNNMLPRISELTSLKTPACCRSHSEIWGAVSQLRSHSAREVMQLLNLRRGWRSANVPPPRLVQPVLWGCGRVTAVVKK